MWPTHICFGSQEDSLVSVAAVAHACLKYEQLVLRSAAYIDMNIWCTTYYIDITSFLLYMSSSVVFSSRNLLFQGFITFTCSATPGALPTCSVLASLASVGSLIAFAWRGWCAQQTTDCRVEAVTRNTTSWKMRMPSHCVQSLVCWECSIIISTDGGNTDHHLAYTSQSNFVVAPTFILFCNVTTQIQINGWPKVDVRCRCGIYYSWTLGGLGIGWIMDLFRMTALVKRQNRCADPRRRRSMNTWCDCICCCVCGDVPGNPNE